MEPTDRDWPSCACGCGEPVPVRKGGNGGRRGEPCKFVAGHSNRPRVVRVVDGKKRCPKCETTKPAEDFNKAANRPSGYDVYCRECMSAKHRVYNKKNRAKRTARARVRREANLEVERAKQRERVARWRERHHADHLLAARIYASDRRARIRGQFVEKVDHMVVYERDAGICGLCGMQIVGSFTVDHIIPISKGGPHSYENVQLAHPTCNFSKRDRTYVKDCEEQAEGDRGRGVGPVRSVRPGLGGDLERRQALHLRASQEEGPSRR